MLLVETNIGPSKIHGIGLFAAQFISKGTPIWRFLKGFDIEVNEHDLARLLEPARKQFLHFAYRDPKTKLYTLCFDNARFTNHSDKPNTVTIINKDGEEIDIAAQDIKSGEEITYNYGDLEDDYGENWKKY